MIRKLQFLKTAVLSVFLLGGANLAWADDVTPTLDVFFRTNDANDGWNSNKWNDKSYPIKGSDAGDIEFAAHHSARMFVLQKYTVEHLDAVKSLTLTLTGSSGTDALAIWAFDTNDWTESTAASTLAPKVESIVGLALGSTSGSANTTYLKNEQNTKTTVVTGINACTFVISGTALETLKNKASGNTFTLLITNKVGEITGGNDRKFYSSGHSTQSYRPTLTVTYDAVGVAYDDGTMANYSSFEAARNAVVSAAKDATITVMEDQNITSRVNAISGKTLNIVAGKDGVTLTNTMTNTLSFLANASNNGTINIGNAAHSMIIKNASATTNAIVEVSGDNADAKVNLTNVTFKDITSSNSTGLIKTNQAKGKVTLTDVTFDGCTASATNAGIVYCNSNGMVTLSGNLTFTDCTGHHFSLNGRLEESSFNANQLYTIYTTIGLSSSAVIKMNAANREKYELVNENRCLVGKGNATNEELVVSEAYTLSVSAANAATLIIPFETTIPSGVSCYTLHYTAGNSAATKTLVETTLPANTPVLINATGSNEGTKYKFNASTRATSATPASTSESHTVGALTGVYDVTIVPSESYILYNGTSGLGFYKSDGSTNTVKAYRAYLTADGVGSRMFIGFDDETTGIDSVVKQDTKTADNVYYNLSGQRVANPSKGLYIVNGKKVIIK